MYRAVACLAAVAALAASAAGDGDPPVVRLAVPGADLPAPVTRYEDTGSAVRFLLDARGRVGVLLQPRQMPIVAGQTYWVNTSYYDPRIVIAAEDGRLDLTFDTPRNCTVVVAPCDAPAPLPNPGFEEGAEGALPDGWMRDGSGGDATRTERAAKEGKGSLRLVKDASPEHVGVRSAPVPVRAGTRYLVSARYHAEGASFGSSARLVATVESPGRDEATAEDGYLRARLACRDQEWRRSFCTISVPVDREDATITVRMLAGGAPFTICWDELDVRPAPPDAPQHSKPLPPSSLRPEFSPEEVADLWRDRPPWSVSPPTLDGAPLLTGGERTPLYWFAANYWPAGWRESSAHRDMAAAGLRVHTVPISGWHPYGPPVWTGPGAYDFSQLDRDLAYVLGHDPDLRIVLYVGVSPYPGFCDEFPDAAWINAQGRRCVGEKEGVRDEADRKPGEPLQHSLTAPDFRREGSAFLRALGRHLHESVLGKAVVGAHLAVGTDGQWFKPGWVEGFGEIDRSPGNLEAFRGWLRRRYRNDEEALREAWNDRTADFDTARLPAEERRLPEEWVHQRPGPGQQVVDANLFIDEGRSETLNLFARAFKEGISRPALVTTYYPNKHHGMRTWLTEPWVDGTVAVQEYGFWRPTGHTGEIATFPGSLRLHRKFFLAELDLRTENADSWGQNAADHDRAIVITHGPAEGAAQLRRDLGATLAQGGGAWHYSLMGNSWNDPEHMATIEEGLRAAARAAAVPMPDDVGQMGVFSDETAEHRCTSRDLYGPRVRYYGSYGARECLSRSGLSWDHYLLSDLDHPDRPDYRLLLFLTSGSITPEQVAWVRENLQKDGRVLVFVHNAGEHLGPGFRENIRALTGMSVDVDPANRLWRNADPVPGDPLTAGVDWLPPCFPAPCYVVDDPAAVPLARYRGEERVGAAVKRHDGWTAVYLAVPGGFTPRLLRNLAAEAGIVPVGPENDVTLAGNGFLVLHALHDGEKTLQWDAPSDVVDLATGVTVARRATRLSFVMQARETRWFRRGPPGPADP